jgi:hypothetical protein
MIRLGIKGLKAMKNVPSGGTTLHVFHACNEKYLQARNSGGTI